MRSIIAYAGHLPSTRKQLPHQYDSAAFACAFGVLINDAGTSGKLPAAPVRHRR
jgi:hypothetical protein